MRLYHDQVTGLFHLDIRAVWAIWAALYPPPPRLPRMPAPLGEGEEATPEYLVAVEAATPPEGWHEADELSKLPPPDWAGDERFVAYETVLPPAVEWDETIQEQPPVDGQQVWAVVKLTGEALAQAEAARAPKVPAEVAMWQARTVMAGVPVGDTTLLDAVNAAVAQMDRTAQVLWEFAPGLRRDAPLLAALAPGFGLTDEQIDGLFVQAARLR